MASPTIDPRIIIKPSKTLLRTVLTLYEEESSDVKASKDTLPVGISKCIENSEGSDNDLSFDIDDIKWIYERKNLLNSLPLNHSSKDVTDLKSNLHFHELISECQVTLPQPQFPPRDPILEARCQKLRAQQAEREYQKMTSNVDSRVHGLNKHSDTDSFSHQMKELNNYLLIVAQLVISLICSFAFGYLVPYYFYGVIEVGPRLISGIMFAFVVGLADLYFVVKFLLETEGVIQGDTIKSYDKSAYKQVQRKVKYN